MRALLSKALELGKGVLHPLHPLDGLATAMNLFGTGLGVGQVQVFSTKRACPQCGTSYAELDPRLFSYNSKHGWCGTCVGTGLALTREQRRPTTIQCEMTKTRAANRAFPLKKPRWKAWPTWPAPIERPPEST